MNARCRRADYGKGALRAGLDAFGAEAASVPITPDMIRKLYNITVPKVANNLQVCAPSPHHTHTHTSLI
jgi:hypothetical protein